VTARPEIVVAKNLALDTMTAVIAKLESESPALDGEVVQQLARLADAERRPLQVRRVKGFVAHRGCGIDGSSDPGEISTGRRKIISYAAIVSLPRCDVARRAETISHPAAPMAARRF
jgi:hypothetical protein